MIGNSLGNIVNSGIAAQKEDWIYYRSSDDNKIYKIRTDYSGHEKINDDNSWDINVVGDWIYYQNPDDGEKIYKIRIDGSGNKKINDDLSWDINIAGDWIYYRNTFDVWKTYKIRTDGSGKQRAD